jgi:hypothetical protein
MGVSNEQKFLMWMCTAYKTEDEKFTVIGFLYIPRPVLIYILNRDGTEFVFCFYFSFLTVCLSDSVTCM